MIGFLKVQHQPVPVVQPSNRVQAEIRAAAAERRREHAAANSLPARPGDASVSSVRPLLPCCRTPLTVILQRRAPVPPISTATGHSASPATIPREIDESGQAQAPASTATLPYFIPMMQPVVSVRRFAYQTGRRNLLTLASDLGRRQCQRPFRFRTPSSSASLKVSRPGRKGRSSWPVRRGVRCHPPNPDYAGGMRPVGVPARPEKRYPHPC